MGLQPDGSTGL